jgi:hypothetical protein
MGLALAWLAMLLLLAVAGAAAERPAPAWGIAGT